MCSLSTTSKTSKPCSKCGEVKPLDAFYKNKLGKFGRSSRCRICIREIEREKAKDLEIRERRRKQSHDWYLRNKDIVHSRSRARYRADLEKNRAYSRDYYKKNAELHCERTKRWKVENYEHYRAQQTEYSRKNSAKILHNTRMRQTRQKNATPSWVDVETLAAIYEESARISKETGVLHHVDHIVPLTHEKVSGLHVPWNLQILPAQDNWSKGNKFEVDSC